MLWFLLVELKIKLNQAIGLDQVIHFLTEYIIGTMNHWDAPMSIASKINVLNQYALTGINEEDRNALRQQIITTTKKDIQALAKDMQYMLEHAVICVCGSAEVLKAHPRFDVIEVYAPEGIQTAQPEIIHLEDAFQ